MSRSDGIQYTVTMRGFIPILMVRRLVPDIAPGNFCWSRWRMANLSEVKDAVIKLQELDRP